MADKKKMSVAEILAAARKMDSGGEAVTSAEAAAAPQPSAPEAPAAPKPKPPAAPAITSGGGRPSVADMLAMARGEKAKGGDGAAAKAASPKPPKAPAAKPAAAKTAVAETSKPANHEPKGARGPLDTASILAAARKTEKAGPVSKAEAARLKADHARALEPKQPVKAKPEVPPMPIKPAYAQRPAPAPKPVREVAPPADDRRGFLMLGWGALAAVGALWTLATARFMYPNVLREPPNRFKVGFPGDFAPGTVEEKFKAQFGVWVVNTEYNGEQQLFALKSVCTHLGCTPNWLEAEQKFKCPCHGSGFYKDGINFEGPAPRPLERYIIRVADDGQVEIDKSRIFQEEMGQWSDPASFVPV
jgi:cytochrome b6-f complex iron-sulfur subunit